MCTQTGAATTNTKCPITAKRVDADVEHGGVAGGLFRTGTRPMLNHLLLLLHASVRAGIIETSTRQTFNDFRLLRASI